MGSSEYNPRRVGRFRGFNVFMASRAERGLSLFPILSEYAGVHPCLVRRLVFAEGIGMVTLGLVCRTKDTFHGLRYSEQALVNL